MKENFHLKRQYWTVMSLSSWVDTLAKPYKCVEVCRIKLSANFNHGTWKFHIFYVIKVKTEIPAKYTPTFEKVVHMNIIIYSQKVPSHNCKIKQTFSFCIQLVNISWQRVCVTKFMHLVTLQLSLAFSWR